MKTNKNVIENCLDTMGRMKDGSIDLTITSPPYDNLRDYDGYSFDFPAIAGELYRITKRGGVLVWIVADATIKGSETGSSFRQALHFMDIGFRLHDTMIWAKPNFSFSQSNRYHNTFEYMFAFSKGKPAVFNPIKDRPNKRVGERKQLIQRKKDGSLVRSKHTPTVGAMGQRYNVWQCPTESHGANHPAPFPLRLAADHVRTWSHPGDIVYDPFLGSGTTAVAAAKLGRQYLGSELSKAYFEYAGERLNPLSLR